MVFSCPNGIGESAGKAEVFLGKSALKICSKYTGEHLCGGEISIKLLCNFIWIARADFSQLLRVVLTRSALFEKWYAFFSTENLKNSCLFWGCSVLNALNLEKWGVKIHSVPLYWTFLPFFGYTTRVPLFSRSKPWSHFGIDVKLLYIFRIPFPRTRLKGCFWRILLRSVDLLFPRLSDSKSSIEISGKWFIFLFDEGIYSNAK